MGAVGRFLETRPWSSNKGIVHAFLKTTYKLFEASVPRVSGNDAQALKGPVVDFVPCRRFDCRHYDGSHARMGPMQAVLRHAGLWPVCTSITLSDRFPTGSLVCICQAVLGMRWSAIRSCYVNNATASVHLYCASELRESIASAGSSGQHHLHDHDWEWSCWLSPVARRESNPIFNFYHGKFT